MTGRNLTLLLVFWTTTAVAALLLDPAPEHARIRNYPECAPARDTLCLVFRARIADTIRQELTTRPVADLYWALYREGDVGIRGPRAPVFRSGREQSVDLAGENPHLFPVPDISPGSYHVLAFFDVTHPTDPENPAAGSGDLVTFPSEAMTLDRPGIWRIDLIFDRQRGI